jgi:hypothetical protein
VREQLHKAEVEKTEPSACRTLKLGEIPGQVGVGFVPVHLGFTAPAVGLRHVGLPDQQPKCPLPVVNATVPVTMPFRLVVCPIIPHPDLL